MRELAEEQGEEQGGGGGRRVFARGNQDQDDERIGTSARLYLEPEEIDRIKKDPIGWLDAKFDQMYDHVEDGQVLESPLMNQMQQAISVASSFISTHAERFHLSAETIKSFNDVFNTRLNLIFSRSVIAQNNTESVKGTVARLRSHGLFYALGMEGGRVNVMFNRLGELLEDQRLAQTDFRRRAEIASTQKEKNELIAHAQKMHVTPEMMQNLQPALIDEQMRMARMGVGSFADDYQKLINSGMAPQQPGVAPMSEEAAQEFANRQIERQIRRTIRTAYDAFVITQRQGVIVSRGHHLEGISAFKSDPAAFFRMFNLEELLTEKFGQFNRSAHEFLDYLKLEMAESKLSQTEGGRTRLAELKSLPKAERKEALLDYGTRMFKVFYDAPDFFSSGWRIDDIRVKLGDYVRNAKANETEEMRRGHREVSKEEDFALFLRLKKADEPREKIWGRIAEIRPEEMLRLFRQRAMENPKDKTLSNKLHEFLSDPVFDRYRAEGADDFKVYDEFKKEFGAITQIIRQQNYEKYHALRISREGFGADERTQIAKYFGGDWSKADRLFDMYIQLTKVAGKADTISLLMSDKFEDIYTRELLVDDVLLNVIDKPVDGITPLSSAWQSEPAQDPLVRNFGDLLNMSNAASELVKFINDEDPKTRLEAATKFAELVSAYNGQEARAEAIRYTAGTFLEASKQDFIWDALGVGKLPFRKTMSEIERIYGPQAKPMTRDELRHQLDQIHSLLESAVAKADTPEGKEKARKNSEKYYHELEKRLEVTAGDMVKRRATSLLFFMILAALLEGYAILDLKGMGVTRK